MAKTNSVARPRVLVIAGSDSSGGAGMQRDLAVLAGQQVRVACVVTAITAQSDSKVRSVHSVPATSIADQLASALEEPIDAIKIGMLSTRECVQIITESLRELPSVPVVIDPVLASSSGRALLQTDALDALRDELCPLATVVTPNLAEAEILLGEKHEQAMQAERLAAQFGCAVLVKGGHGSGKFAIDVLAQPGHPAIALSTPRIEATMRGTGCALSSLIAAKLAHGHSVERACRVGKEEVSVMLQAKSSLARLR